MFGTYFYKNCSFNVERSKETTLQGIQIAWKGRLFPGNETAQLSSLISNRSIQDSLNSLDGQFAIALNNPKKRTLLLARDHFGVMPMYYYATTDKVFFGTEISDILINIVGGARMNFRAIHEYFTFRYLAGRKTLFEEIRQVLPGTFVLFDWQGKQSEIHYFRPERSERVPPQGQTCESAFEKGFWSSLKKQTFDSGEKKIGVLSSGGIDSSILVSCATHILPAGFSTYYIGNEGYKFNRTDDVEYLSRLHSTRHQNFFCSGHQFSEHLIDTIRINEEPLNHPSSVLRYFLNQQIGNEIEVLLSGEGADCLFCGYYVLNLLGYAFVNNPLRPLTRFLADLIPISKIPSKYHRKLLKIQKAFTMPPGQYALYSAELVSLDPEIVSQLMNDPFPENFDADYTDVLYGVPPDKILDAVLSIYQGEYLVEALRTLTKIGNATGIEFRHPFIDAGLVNLFNNFPWSQKVRFFQRKRQVVTLGKKSLPKQFFTKSKEGFGVPLKTWFQEKNGLGRFIGLLLDRKTRERGLFNTDFLDRLLENHNCGNMSSEAYETILWPIVNMELWLRIFMDGDIKGKGYS